MTLSRPTTANEFRWISTVAAGTQPGGGRGTLVTPLQNAMGSWTELVDGALVTSRVYGFWVHIRGGGSSTAIRDTIFDIGTDPSAGTSYAAIVSGLIASASPNYISATPSPGIVYWFPLEIPAGASIAARSAQNNAAPLASRIEIRLAVKPTRPDLVWSGKYCRTYGVNTAASNGTSVTPGTTSEGAWSAALGSVAAGDKIKFWNAGLGYGSGAMDNAVLHVDLGIGDGSAKRLVTDDLEVFTNTGEVLSYTTPGNYAAAAPGDSVYARAQTAGTTTTSYTAVAYGVG